MSRKETKEENWKRIAEIDYYLADRKEKLNNQKRLLISQGSLDKVCRSENQPKMFFLFDDILIYASIISSDMAFSPYRNWHTFPLKEVKIENIEENDSSDVFTRFGWNILTPSKSFTVYATDKDTKDIWMKNLQKYINRQTSTDSPTWYAPVWIPDSTAKKCKNCEGIFNFVTRRHHCRSCGNVFCHACSDCKVILPNISQRPVRVCRECCESGNYQRRTMSQIEDKLDDTQSNSDSE